MKALKSSYKSNVRYMILAAWPSVSPKGQLRAGGQRLNLKLEEVLLHEHRSIRFQPPCKIITSGGEECAPSKRHNFIDVMYAIWVFGAYMQLASKLS